MYKMILKQHTQYSPKDYAPDGPFAKNSSLPDMSELFQPQENIIRDQLISALIGQEVSDAERQILALPLRHGGLGLTNPRRNC